MVNKKSSTCKSFRIGQKEGADKPPPNNPTILLLISEVVSGHEMKTLKHIYLLFIESMIFDR
ncbi:hypothetical protein CT113_08655 [Levilactobacillus brevis]|nr:hypothetical protein CT113_08655 [Levilactobacillus brevis]